VIVGGGFAGVTPARELTMRGRRCCSRRAIGWVAGPTRPTTTGIQWNSVGTWVHPLQPNVWAEISRNGMETETFPVLWAVARTFRGDSDDALLGQGSFA
jgi:hypothetical protein